MKRRLRKEKAMKMPGNSLQLGLEQLTETHPRPRRTQPRHLPSAALMSPSRIAPTLLPALYLASVCFVRSFNDKTPPPSACLPPPGPRGSAAPSGSLSLESVTTSSSSLPAAAEPAAAPHPCGLRSRDAGHSCSLVGDVYCPGRACPAPQGPAHCRSPSASLPPVRSTAKSGSGADCRLSRPLGQSGRAGAPSGPALAACSSSSACRHTKDYLPSF
jgi:hypothetical protein